MHFYLHRQCSCCRTAAADTDREILGTAHLEWFFPYTDQLFVHARWVWRRHAGPATAGCLAESRWACSQAPRGHLAGSVLYHHPRAAAHTAPVELHFLFSPRPRRHTVKYPHCNVGLGFVIPSIYGSTNIYGTGSVKIWKTCHTAFRWYTSTSTFHQPQPTCSNASSAIFGLTPMVVGLSQSLAQQSGTVSQISSGTRQSALTLSDVYWRRICLRDTSACSTLEVDNFMRYINLLTYLLTYLQNPWIFFTVYTETAIEPSNTALHCSVRSVLGLQFEFE